VSVSPIVATFTLKLFPFSLNGTFPERLIPDGVIPSAADRIPVTQSAKLMEFGPLLLLFYILAVLVQLPNTRVLRLSILPAMGILSWRYCTRYNFDGSDEPGYNLGSMTTCVSQSSFLAILSPGPI
jgi:hypothetical protein